MNTILAADIGGTKSRFGYFSLSEKDELQLVDVKWLSTSQYTSFDHLLEGLSKSGFLLPLSAANSAVLSIAGPVSQGTKCSPPFIPWSIDISTCNKLPKNSLLINDFVAQAYACKSPLVKQAESIKSGCIEPNSTSCVIGAGTGLGKAIVLQDGRGGYIAAPSEGGHANFPFESSKEFDFQTFLLKKTGDTYITWNKVVSGQGLSYIHDFLTGQNLDPKEISKVLNEKKETLEWAARFYGRTCRNFALECLALGGMYISGGVAARNPEIVTHESFFKEFENSDTLHYILKEIPIYLLANQNAGLWGAGFLGKQRVSSAQ